MKSRSSPRRSATPGATSAPAVILPSTVVPRKQLAQLRAEVGFRELWCHLQDSTTTRGPALRVELSSPKVDESLTDLAALAEDLERDGEALLAVLPKPLVVELLDGVVERPRLVAPASRDVQRVKDGLGPVSAQGDRGGGVLDQPQLDRIGDRSSSCGSLGARLVCSLHPQALRHPRRRSFVERVPPARDLEHDLHSASLAPPWVGGAVMLPGAGVFSPPVATLTSSGSTWAEAAGASLWWRPKTVLICIFGRWPAHLEDDVRCPLWCCRTAGSAWGRETRTGSVSGRAFVFVDETAKRVGLRNRVEHGSRERQ